MAMAASSSGWTLDELHRLPDDGNKYELVRGELFVAPAPSMEHETLIARLNAHLLPYVMRHGLGLVYHARTVVRAGGSEVEPDLMVRPEMTMTGDDWENAPLPILVVEVTSSSTRRRDLTEKRAFYRDLGIAEYWVIDPPSRRVHVTGPDRSDTTVVEQLTWHPAGAIEPLHIHVAPLFG